MSVATVHNAEVHVLSCERCDRRANTPFRRVLDRLAHRQRGTTEYLLIRMPKCPRCEAPLFEDTLVELGVDWYLQ